MTGISMLHELRFYEIAAGKLADYVNQIRIFRTRAGKTQQLAALVQNELPSSLKARAIGCWTGNSGGRPRLGQSPRHRSLRARGGAPDAARALQERRRFHDRSRGRKAHIRLCDDRRGARVHYERSRAAGRGQQRETQQHAARRATVAESGIPGFDVNTWLGALMPRGTPVAIVVRFNAAILSSLQLPEVRERLKTVGAEAMGSTPAELAVHLKTELTRWTTLAKTVKIEVSN